MILTYFNNKSNVRFTLYLPDAESRTLTTNQEDEDVCHMLIGCHVVRRFHRRQHRDGFQGHCKVVGGTRGGCCTFALELLFFRFYRPQTKLREGKVFTGICLSTGECGWGVGTSYASWDRSHGRVPFPSIEVGWCVIRLL